MTTMRVRTARTAVVAHRYAVLMGITTKGGTR